VGREILSSGDTREIVIEIGPKQLVAIILICCVAAYVVGSYFISLATHIAPSQQLPIHITDAFSASHVGAPKNEFKRGELVLINVTLEMGWAYYFNTEYYYLFTAPTEYLLLVQIMHDNTPMFLGFVVESVSPGETESTGVGYRIPDDAPLGTYTVKVMVWSTWLDKGGVVLADNSGLTFQFTVVEG